MGTLLRYLLPPLFLAWVGAGIASEAAGAANNSASQPNIVLIMADDLGWGDVGYHGSEISTPAIDGLAEAGVKLERFYTYPTCTQTRGALMSGQRMRTVGLLEPMPPWSDAGLPLDIATLADGLRAAGYATWKVGKWHLGDHYLVQFPNQRGFDHFYGFLSGEVNYETHVFASALDWQRNGETLEEAGYATHLLTDEAVRLLANHNGDKPYYLDLSYNAPHTPLQAPASALADYQHIEDKNRRRFAAMVSEMDRGIAKVLSAVRARPDADRTLILFVSDNGGMARFGGSNVPLKGGKINHYEGGIRVPAIATWPGQLEPGQTNEFISVHDLFPTLLGLAGVAVEHSAVTPGVNVWAALADGVALERQEPLVFALMMPGRPGSPATYSASIIRDGWKLIETSAYRRKAPQEQRYAPPRRELFNVIEDPQEKHDLIDRETDRAAELADLLAAIPRGQPIGFKPPPPDWKMGVMPGAEPDNSPPTRTSLVEAAREREQAAQ